MVLVPEYVADAHNLGPRNVRLASLELRRNTAGGFGDDLDTALNAMPKKPVRTKIVEGLPSHGRLDAFDRFTNCVKRRLNKPAPSKDALGGSLDSVLKQRVETVSGRQIDLNAKAAFQELLDADQFYERESAAAIVIDEKIEVASQARVIARGRSEQVEPRSAKRLHRAGLRPQSGDRVLSCHGCASNTANGLPQTR